MLPLLEAVAARVLVGALNRIAAHIQAHGLNCGGAPSGPPPTPWEGGGAAHDDSSTTCSSQSSAVVEATAHFDPGAHFWA